MNATALPPLPTIGASKAPSQELDIHTVSCIVTWVDKAVEDLRLARMYCKPNAQAMREIQAAGEAVMRAKRVFDGHYKRTGRMPA